ncbi:MAG: aspartyl-phosphate phosphatase Spo0E family protein [Bacillota bacterium]|nr:aspartyl-phosphate phosphatase Spo0E family protein [Bacillota bacterium]
MFVSDELRKQVIIYQKKLNELVTLKSIDNEDVYKLSTELDKLILTFYSENSKKPAC